jgi:hypothetical protein
MQFPLDDWQFWIAAALMLASALYVLRSVVAVGEGATCHCGKSLDPQGSPKPKPVALSISAGRSASGAQESIPD